MKAGSPTTTKSIDENCNGLWDDNVGGTVGCPSGEQCANWTYYSDPLCTTNMTPFFEGACMSSAAISVVGGGFNNCMPDGNGMYFKFTPSSACIVGGTFY